MSFIYGKGLIGISGFLIVRKIFLIWHIRGEGLVHGETVVQLFYELSDFHLACIQFFLGKDYQCTVVVQYKDIWLQYTLYCVQNHITQKFSRDRKSFIGQEFFKGHIADGAWFLHKAQVCAGVLDRKRGKGRFSLKKGEEQAGSVFGYGFRWNRNFPVSFFMQLFGRFVQAGEKGVRTDLDL